LYAKVISHLYISQNLEVLQYLDDLYVGKIKITLVLFIFIFLKQFNENFSICTVFSSNQLKQTLFWNFFFWSKFLTSKRLSEGKSMEEDFIHLCVPTQNQSFFPFFLIFQKKLNKQNEFQCEIVCMQLIQNWGMFFAFEEHETKLNQFLLYLTNLDATHPHNQTRATNTFS